MYQLSRLIVVITLTLVAAGCATGGSATRPRTPAPGPTARTPPSAPTEGQFINATSWSLRVWVDADPANRDSAAAVVLKPGETVPWTLSQGQHRIVVQAHSPGQSGGKVVARFDRTIALDPARPDGWYLRFREADFR